MRRHRSYSSLGVLNWEGNLRSAEEVVAVLDHLTIIIVEEDTPTTDHPAAKHRSHGVSVNDPVEDVISKWGSGLSTSNHSDDGEGKEGEGLSIVFHSFLF